MARLVVRRALLMVWLAVIAAATLTPTADASRQLSLCIACGETGASELLLNVVLFAPLGALLVARGHSAMRAMLTGAALSVGIEAVQWLVIPGRVTSMGDLLANTLGAAAGALAWRHRAHWLAPRGAAGRAVVASYAACVALLLGVGAWSSQPWLPDGTWYMQRAPVRPWSDAHSGTLRLAAIDATDLPSDRIADRTLVTALREGSAALFVEEEAGPATARLAYTVRLVQHEGGHEVFAMARTGNALVLHRLTNAARWGLSTVGLRLPGVYSGLDGRALHWRVAPRRGEVALRLVDGARREGDAARRQGAAALDAEAVEQRFAMLAPSVWRGWGALLPRAVNVTPAIAQLLDAAWGVVLVAPFVAWTLGAGMARRRSPAP